MAVDLSKLFPRSYELNDETDLTFYQSEIGDVGCVVWDAALVMCKYLQTKDFDGGKFWQGKSVIDLGSGTGAVGLVASSLGANSVITDLPDFVPLMEHNIFQNSSYLTGKCHAETLVWGDEKRVCELKEKYFPQGLDFVLLADCVYYEQSIDALVETIIALCSKTTTVLCSYEERELGNKEAMQKHFFELIGEHFHISEVPLSSQDPEFSSEDIHIIKFTLKS